MAKNPAGSHVGGVALTREEKRRAEGATEEDIAFERNKQAVTDQAQNRRQPNQRGESHVGGVSLDREAQMRAEGATEEEIIDARRKQASADLAQDVRPPGAASQGTVFTPYGYGDPALKKASGKYGGSAQPYFADPTLTDYSMQDPELYANTREAYASRGWDPGIDQRNFQVGREAGGAQSLRDYAKMGGAAATAFGAATADRALDLGASRSDALSALGEAGGRATADAGANLLNNSENARNVAAGYGSELKGYGRLSSSLGESLGANVRDTAATYAGDLRDVYASEGPSGAAATFGLNADKAILEGARTGNRRAVANDMSSAGMGSALMRAGENADWRNNQRTNAMSAGGLEMSGLTQGASLAAGGHRQGANLARSGADLEFQGSSAALDAKNAGYGALLGGQQFEAGTDLSSDSALLDSYGSASDAYFDGMDTTFGAEDAVQAVDEMELRGSMGAWEQMNMRETAEKAYKQRLTDIDAQKEMAKWGLIGDGITTLASLA